MESVLVDFRVAAVCIWKNHVIAVYQVVSDLVDFIQIEALRRIFSYLI